MLFNRLNLGLYLLAVTGAAIWAAFPQGETATAQGSKPAALSAAQGDTYAAQLYEQKCAICHDGTVPEAPTKQAMQKNTANAIMAVLTTGVMREQARGISSFDKERLAVYLGGAASDAERRKAPIKSCEGKLSFSGRIGWNRWGADKSNSRYRSAHEAGIGPANVGRLKLHWAFGFPGAVRARSQPAVTPEAIFIGSQDGTVYALDTQTGCVWWRFFADAEVRSAPTIATDTDGRPERLYFGDFNANVYAVDARSGREIWRASLRDHAVTTITGSPTLHEDRLYVPLSSTEVISAFMPDYECCTFRGGIVALDADTGVRAWRFHTVPDPRHTGENAIGVKRWGPSGAPIWSSPTVDAKRGLLYAGTGENYSSPATDLSDAIIAIDLETGELAWARQTIPGDAWNGACGSTRINCPQENGPDFDFGAPPVLLSLREGKDIILAGQKSGMVFGLDPEDEGRILWSRRAGMGGFNGGVHWGMAGGGETLYVGIADTPSHAQAVGPPRPGVHAYHAATGEELWSVIEEPLCPENQRRCQTAISAAVTATPDLVFAGALNGLLRIYSAQNGDVLWSFDTNRPFETVNGVEATGGSIDSDGPVVTDGMLIVNSGYDKFRNLPGNVLLVFKIED